MLFRELGLQTGAKGGSREISRRLPSSVLSILGSGSFEYKFRVVLVCLFDFLSWQLWDLYKKIIFYFLSPDCLKVIFLGFSREAREAHGGPCDSSAAELVDTPLPSKVGRETPAFICL